jgi:hypothetical protein
MPPHCDSMDGPVVTAAKKALATEQVNLILPYVAKTGEEELIRVFQKVIPARKEGALAREVADQYFFETVVRVHRAGEGLLYRLKPRPQRGSGYSRPRSDRNQSPDELLQVLLTRFAPKSKRFERVMHPTTRRRKRGRGRVRRGYAGSACMRTNSISVPKLNLTRAFIITDARGACRGIPDFRRTAEVYCTKTSAVS